MAKLIALSSAMLMVLLPSVSFANTITDFSVAATGIFGSLTGTT